MGASEVASNPDEVANGVPVKIDGISAGANVELPAVADIYSFLA
jgi:hypothetical protein